MAHIIRWLTGPLAAAAVLLATAPAALAEVTAPPVTPLQVNTAAQITPSPSPALGSSRYPRAFIEWKLSGSAGM